MPRKTPAKVKKQSSRYPQETNGSRMAAKLRKRANTLSDEERESHFQAGMAMIYGGSPTAGARH